MPASKNKQFTVKQRKLDIYPNKNKPSEVELLLEELNQPPIKTTKIDKPDDTKFFAYSVYDNSSNEFINSLEGIDVVALNKYNPTRYSDLCGLSAYSQKEMLTLDLLILREYTLQGKPVPLDVSVII